eukprot:Clim_evm249s157 gene=Clim_evmTU249s157
MSSCVFAAAMCLLVSTVLAADYATNTQYAHFGYRQQVGNPGSAGLLMVGVPLQDYGETMLIAGEYTDQLDFDGILLQSDKNPKTGESLASIFIGRMKAGIFAKLRSSSMDMKGLDEPPQPAIPFALQNHGERAYLMGLFEHNISFGTDNKQVHLTVPQGHNRAVFVICLSLADLIPQWGRVIAVDKEGSGNSDSESQDLLTRGGMAIDKDGKTLLLAVNFRGEIGLTDVSQDSGGGPLDTSETKQMPSGDPNGYGLALVALDPGTGDCLQDGEGYGKGDFCPKIITGDSAQNRITVGSVVMCTCDGFLLSGDVKGTCNFDESHTVTAGNGQSAGWAAEIDATAQVQWTYNIAVSSSGKDHYSTGRYVVHDSSAVEAILLGEYNGDLSLPEVSKSSSLGSANQDIFWVRIDGDGHAKGAARVGSTAEDNLSSATFNLINGFTLSGNLGKGDAVAESLDAGTDEDSKKQKPYRIPLEEKGPGPFVMGFDDKDRPVWDLVLFNPKRGSGSVNALGPVAKNALLITGRLAGEGQLYDAFQSDGDAAYLTGVVICTENCFDLHREVCSVGDQGFCGICIDGFHDARDDQAGSGGIGATNGTDRMCVPLESEHVGSTAGIVIVAIGVILSVASLSIGAFFFYRLKRRTKGYRPLGRRYEFTRLMGDDQHELNDLGDTYDDDDDDDEVVFEARG